jgi:hypothetical protein
MINCLLNGSNIIENVALLNIKKYVVINLHELFISSFEKAPFQMPRFVYWIALFLACCRSSPWSLREISQHFPNGWDQHYVQEMSETFTLNVYLLKYLADHCKRAPVNSLTGGRYLILVVLDKDFEATFESGVCQWTTGRSYSGLIYICFEKSTYKELKSLGVKCLLFEGFLKDMRSRGIYRLVFADLVTRAGIECYIVGGNVILFDDFLEIWRWECDMEFDLDHQGGYDLKLMNIAVGSTDLVRYMPVPIVSQFLEKVLDSVTFEPGPSDHRLIWSSLKPTLYRPAPLRWTSIVGDANISYTFVEPWRVPNIDAALCHQRGELCWWANKHNLAGPLAVRFNRIVSVEVATALLKNLSLLVTDKCTRLRFPWWRRCRYPKTMDCKMIFE